MPMNARLLRPKTSGFLLDGVGAGAEFAFSLRRLRSSYTGNAVKLRRSSDNAESDFTPEQITSGAAEAWVGSGNTGYVTTWYDQTTNGRTFTQSTAANQPQVSFATGSLFFPEQAGVAVNGSGYWLQNSTIGITSNAFTFLSVVELTGRNSARNKYGRILSCYQQGTLDYNNPASFLLFDTPDNGANGLNFFRANATVAALPTLALNTKTVAGLRLNGTAGNIYRNKSSAPGTTSATSVNVNRVRIGNSETAFDTGMAGRYYLGVGFKSALSDASVTAITNYLMAQFQVT